VKSAAVTVATTPTLLLGADDLARHVYIHNAGGAKIYLGGSDVTTGTGYHLKNNEAVSIFVPARETIYGIVASDTHVATMLIPDSD
jgi:hypothetical protein